MKVTNKTSDQDEVKICIYFVGDGNQWIPVGGGVFIVKKGHPVDWFPPKIEEKPEYHIKAFKPGIFDKELCQKNHVKLNANVDVIGGGGKYEIQVN